MNTPSNDDRANWAKDAVGKFAHATGLDMKLEMDTAVSDLLSNIMHLCERDGLDFDRLLRSGKDAFDEEVAEKRDDIAPCVG